jgi:predicted TIM-barrel fold metal-dependent hydrolase
MTDSHIHIGQFYEKYYKPLEIMKIIRNAGVSDIVYSSTTSGKGNVKYSEVEKEIELVAARYSPERFQPYLWYVPEYENQGVTVAKALNSFPYKGIKIHPRANDWDMTVPYIIGVLLDIFELANDFKLPILIHTGVDLIDEANKFKPFFDKYHNAKITLAHCRPLEQTLGLLEKYPNVYCDTAFVPQETLQNIVAQGFANKVLLGSDFPITQYYNQDVTLEAQYASDIKVLERYAELLNR